MRFRWPARVSSRLVVCAAVAALGCEPEESRFAGDPVADARAGDAAADATPPDAAAPDAAVDECAGRETRRVCLDADRDGHGDPATAVDTCVSMPDHVEACDDCDDRSADVVPGASETCDGADDDCDDAADEGLGLGEACSGGVGACARAGRTVCLPTGEVGCDARPGPAAAETCNGVDDDCNGTVDDTGAVEVCNDVDDDCDGQTDEGLGEGAACSVGVGACRREGTRVCAAETGRVVCSAQAGAPGAETCDGTDEDCNGLVDDAAEGCDCEEGAQVVCGSDVGQCTLGVQTCVDGRLGPCEGQAGPGEEVCDGEDDDCDGAIDDREGAVCECADGMERACGSDVGECAAGTQRCVDGAFTPCTGTGPVAEACNGLDDDCNGVNDDRAPVCECVDGMRRACGLAIGQCRQGEQACEGGRWGACAGGVGPAAEVCDGEDDDCNGRVDDGIAGLGDACGAGAGACERAGQLVCDPAAGALRCDAEPGPSAEETCNGVDDDCDGAVDDLADEGCGCENGFPVPCPPTVFALGVEVRAPGGAAQATYYQPIDRSMFDGRTITNDAAREVQGIGRLFTLDGHMYLGQRSEPTITRYEVAEDLSTREAGALNFAAHGAPLIDIGHLIVGPTKWYNLIGPTLTAVVFDPRTMEIDHTFDLSSLQKPGYEGSLLLQGTFLFEQKVYGNRGFVSVLHSVSNQNRYYPNMTVAVFDTENDRVLKTIEDPRCYGASTMAQDLNGDVYVSSYSFTGRTYSQAAIDAGVEQKPTCILRIRAGEDEFDPDFFVSFPELLDGKESTRWYPVNARYSYAYAVDRAALTAAPNPSNAVGEIWKIDLQTRTASRVEGLGTTTPFITLGYPDSHDSLVLGVAAEAGSLARTIVYRLVPETDEMQRIFEVNGLFRGFYPIR